MTIATELAHFVTQVRTGDLPELALERARMCLASTVASAAMGYRMDSAAAIRAVEAENGGAPHATVWFSGLKLPASSAARANAAASDAAASDDSDMRSIAHIGTIVATTAMAMGERMDCSSGDMLCAMVLGYEIAGRIDEALTPGRLSSGFHGSVSTIFGGAVAAGRLLQLDAHQMSHAIAIAATSIGGMAISADTSCAREYHAGLSAMLGVHAALAASKGFQAEPAVLEAPMGFFQSLRGQSLAEVTGNLGESWDIVTDMAIKLMPGAHPFHAIAQAAFEAAARADINAEDIAKVEISTSRMHALPNPNLRPDDFIAAAHSGTYFVAAAIVDRRFTWEHAGEAKRMDPAIRQLQDKVVFDPCPPPPPDRFAYRHGGTVRISLTNGQQVERTCRAPRGSHAGGVSWEDVEAKYAALVPLSGLREVQWRQSLEIIRNLESSWPLSRLADLLAIRTNDAREAGPAHTTGAPT